MMKSSYPQAPQLAGVQREINEAVAGWQRVT